MIKMNIIEFQEHQNPNFNVIKTLFLMEKLPEITPTPSLPF